MRRLLPLAAVLVVGCGGSAEPPRPKAPWIVHRDSAHAFQISHPRGWHVADRTLTPQLTDPHEIVSLATFPLRRGPAANCAHIPVQAIKDMGPRDTFITLQERRGSGGFEPRTHPFVLPPPGSTDFGACAGRAGLEGRWGGFKDSGRGLHVLIAFGSRSTAEQRRTAQQLLDSLRLERPYRRHGLRVQLPSGWHVHEKRLTSLGEPRQQLAFASYVIPDRRADRNCTPRAATDALPPDGAFVFVLEYRRLNRTQRMRFPAHPRFRLRQRDRGAYQCFGESWLFRWRSRGRVFQAHAYLGDAATAQRREELLAALRSIVVVP